MSFSDTFSLVAHVGRQLLLTCHSVFFFATIREMFLSCSQTRRILSTNGPRLSPRIDLNQAVVERRS